MKMILKRWFAHRAGSISLIFFLVTLALSLLLPLALPYGPNELSGGISKAPSAAHWLGTDQVGRDVLVRLLYGVRTSVFVGGFAAVISTLIGMLLGLLSGYFGGWLDILIMRVTDVFMSFPVILLILVAAALLKPGLMTIVLIFGLVNWPGVARLVRGSTLAVREKNYILADRLAGMPRRYILFSEIMPNTLAPVLVYATQVFALSILDEAALSFLGLGVQPPRASLGNMLSGAQSITVLTSKYWLWVFAGLTIVCLVLSINFIGDALREALDPREGEIL